MPDDKKHKLLVTGSLLEDVALPRIDELDGDIKLFFNKNNGAQPQEPTDEEVNAFLSGGK